MKLALPFALMVGGLTLTACAPRPPAAASRSTMAVVPSPTAAEEPAPLVEGAAPTTKLPDKRIEDPDFVRPCAPDDPRMAAARAAFETISTTLYDLDARADPKPVIAQLRGTMKEPCLGPADADAPHDLDEADSGWALRDWWERGGRTWLEHYLKLGDPEASWRGPAFAPNLRPTLTREHRPNHPLKALLCGAADQACHEAAPAYRLRAELHFAAEAKADEGDGYCIDDAKAVPPPERYETYVRCLRDETGHQRMLPLGGIRVPTEGWLVLEGSRPNHHDCPEIRAFDLKTGAYYVLRTCDHATKTRIGKEADPVRAKVPLRALREAAWMTLIANEVSEPGLESGFSTMLPDADQVSVEIGWPGGYGGGTMGASGIGSSASNDWHWHFFRRGRRVTGGVLDDPTLHSGTIHARNLLRVAELQQEGSCAPARLPAMRLDTTSSEDADTIARRERVQADAEVIAAGLRKSYRRCR